jgi:hypothetical protein
MTHSFSCLGSVMVLAANAGPSLRFAPFRMTHLFFVGEFVVMRVGARREKLDEFWTGI